MTEHERPLPSGAPCLAHWTSPAGAARARRVTRAGADVLVVPGRYSVSYLLVAPEGIALVDLGSHADLPVIRAALARIGRREDELRLLVPTHLHFDHVLGLDTLARRLARPVALGEVAHAHVTEGRPLRFPTPDGIGPGVVGWWRQGLPWPHAADWRAAAHFGVPWGTDPFRATLGPVLRHGDALPGLSGWSVLATPGHADDAICLYHQAAGFLVAGDTVRNLDGGEWNPLVCDRDDYARTQAFLATLFVETVFPGHGPLVEGPDVIARL